MRVKFRGLVPGLYSEESILQQNSLFFMQLIDIFKSLENKSQLSLAILKGTKVEKLIYDTIGMSVDIQYNPSSMVNAHMVPPMLDANHPLFHPLARSHLNSNDLIKLTHALEKPILKGTVDRAKAKLGGDFSKVTIQIALYKGLLVDKGWTPAEKAAILLHELGHGFTYFECLADIVTTNYSLIAACKAYTDSKDTSSKVLVLREIDKRLGTEIPDKELLATKSNETVYTVIVSEGIKRPKSMFDSGLYDTRTWESLADQFASRFGASKDLVSGLDKIYRKHGAASYRSTPMYILIELLKVLGITLLLLFTVWKMMINLFIIIVLSLLRSPYLDTYDKPEARMVRIREDLADRLKDSSLPTEEVSGILADLKYIDSILGKVRDRKTFWEVVWYYANPSTKSQVDKMSYLKDLESMANNNLYVTAATLRTIQV